MRTRWRFTNPGLTLIAFIFSMSGGLSASSQAPAFDESQIRAGMIVNLTKFIEWPASRQDPHLPFLICAVGTEQVGANLEGLLAGKTIQGRTALVRRGVAMEHAEACHILYIAHPKQAQSKELSSAFALASVLTITEEHPARSGSVIGLPLVDGRVQIEINRPLAQNANLTLSSHLLQIATERR